MGGGQGLLNAQPWRSDLGAQTLHHALEISGVGKLRQAEYLERLRFQPLEEKRYPQPATLGQTKGRQAH